MTGIVIVTAAIVLLIAALAPAHRRSTTLWHPGADLSVDRDHQRLTEDLAAVAQRQVRGPRRAAPPRGPGGGGGAVPRAPSPRGGRFGRAVPPGRAAADDALGVHGPLSRLTTY